MKAKTTIILHDAGKQRKKKKKKPKPAKKSKLADTLAAKAPPNEPEEKIRRGRGEITSSRKKTEATTCQTGVMTCRPGGKRCRKKKRSNKEKTKNGRGTGSGCRRGTQGLGAVNKGSDSKSRIDEKKVEKINAFKKAPEKKK